MSLFRGGSIHTGRDQAASPAVFFSWWWYKCKSTSVRLLPTLLSQAPKSVLLLGVFRTNRMRKSLVQKESFYSLIKEWRGASLSSGGHTLPERLWAGCFTGFLSEGRGGSGVLSWWAPLHCSHSTWRCQHGVSDVACHRHLELPCCAQHLCTRSRPELTCQHSRFTLGTLSEVPGVRPPHVAPYEQVKLDEAQRKRKKKKRLDFITQILFLFPRNF